MLRITGCPNGCARPYLAEVALVGKAPGRYNLFLGGDGRGQRLNALYLENVDEPTILSALDAAFARYAAGAHAPANVSVISPGVPASSAPRRRRETRGASTTMRALAWNPETAMHEPAVLDEINRDLERRSAEDRVRWALDHLPGEHALSSSFGAQAAVSLHMVTRQKPSLPVVLVDTGYLFPETYRFIDDLVEQLELNLKVYQPRMSRGVARGAPRPALGAGRRRHRTLQRPAQDRADASRAHRART